jgi:DNA-binding NarL/FixJ family response regulator
VALSVELRLEIVRRYESGEPMASVAQATYVSCTAVRLALIAHDVPRRPRGPAVEPQTVYVIGRLYETGMTLREIAGVVGLSRETVRVYLDRAELPRRPAAPRRAPNSS